MLWPIPFPPFQQSWEPPQSQLNLKDPHGSDICETQRTSPEGGAGWVTNTPGAWKGNTLERSMAGGALVRNTNAYMNLPEAGGDENVKREWCQIN